MKIVHFTTFWAILAQYLGVNQQKVLFLSHFLPKMLKKYYICGYFTFNVWYNASKCIIFNAF